jgi:hypothetical protein
VVQAAELVLRPWRRRRRWQRLKSRSCGWSRRWYWSRGWGCRRGSLVDLARYDLGATSRRIS